MIKIGIIGAGSIVENSHIPVLKSIAKVQITWISDINELVLRKVAAVNKIRYIKPDLIHSGIKEVDIVLLAIPIGVRDKYINIIADEGKAIYIEKPFARNQLEHEKICSMFPFHKIACGFQRRTYVNISLIRNIIQSKIFGDLLQVNLVECSYNLKSGGSNSFFSNSELSGGGILIESAIHSLDQLVYSIEPNEIIVHKSDGILANGQEYHLSSFADMITDYGNVRINLAISRLYNQPSGITFEFEHATLHMINKPSSNIYLVDKNSRNKTAIKIDYSQPFNICVDTSDKAFFVFWKLFFDAYLTKTINLTSAVTSALTTIWVEKIYRDIYK
jgi:predicted dehydrogenase